MALNHGSEAHLDWRSPFETDPLVSQNKIRFRGLLT
jgi:hypothetical protein